MNFLKIVCSVEEKHKILLSKTNFSEEALQKPRKDRRFRNKSVAI